ncbi:MAG TPA: hypothetical protein VKH15_14335 [Candidatus Acidoferrum sp.]|jgi:hypothetical protein|nr:hypothetical protein [Candidatus Acidoferrum sp.]
MTWKDELLMYWVLWTVLISFVARHFFDGAIYLVQHVASASVFFIPGLLHLFGERLR